MQVWLRARKRESRTASQRAPRGLITGLLPHSVAASGPAGFLHPFPARKADATWLFLIWGRRAPHTPSAAFYWLKQVTGPPGFKGGKVNPPVYGRTGKVLPQEAVQCSGHD